MMSSSQDTDTGPSTPAPENPPMHPHLVSLTGIRRDRHDNGDIENNHDRFDSNVDTQTDSTHIQQQQDQQQQQQCEAPLIENEKTVRMAYMWWLPPMGCFGAHHYYLNNYFFGVFYSLTIGGVGLAWIIDVVRMHNLVKRENKRPLGW